MSTAAVSAIQELLPKANEGSENSDAADGAEKCPELLCVIAVIRHGERTPKQKMKMITSEPTILSLFDTYVCKCCLLGRWPGTILTT